MPAVPAPFAGPGIVRPLLAWYRRAKRDLPWRGATDPYRVWVSEVMLQQTRVEVVKPYYERFVAWFPTLDALARAPLDRVLACWSGLGYYGRARSLHGAVRECRERYGGRVPRDPEAFGGLPGVGPYTCAAVLSIAFGVRLAVVDGNVLRVVARLLALDLEAKSPELRARAAAFAARALPRRSPGDFNQALMELGATVCTPRAPRCPRCPLARRCAARRLGDVGRFPRASTRPAPRQVRWEAAVVERKGAVLLLRRGLEGRFKGMWELPWSAESLQSMAGLALRPGPPIGRVRHSVLDERIEVVVRRATIARAPGCEFAWVRPAALPEYALASVWRKVLRAAGMV
jgi:A/G-specific adenine glycosylase